MATLRSRALLVAFWLLVALLTTSIASGDCVGSRKWSRVAVMDGISTDNGPDSVAASYASDDGIVTIVLSFDRSGKQLGNFSGVKTYQYNATSKKLRHLSSTPMFRRCQLVFLSGDGASLLLSPTNTLFRLSTIWTIDPSSWSLSKIIRTTGDDLETRSTPWVSDLSRDGRHVSVLYSNHREDETVHLVTFRRIRNEWNKYGTVHSRRGGTTIASQLSGDGMVLALSPEYGTSYGDPLIQSATLYVYDEAHDEWRQLFASFNDPPLGEPFTMIEHENRSMSLLSYRYGDTKELILSKPVLRNDIHSPVEYASEWTYQMPKRRGRTGYFERETGAVLYTGPKLELYILEEEGRSLHKLDGAKMFLHRHAKFGNSELLFMTRYYPYDEDARQSMEVWAKIKCKSEPSSGLDL